MNVFSKSQGKMKKILEKSGKSQGILSEEKSGNPEYVWRAVTDPGFLHVEGGTICFWLMISGCVLLEVKQQCVRELVKNIAL